MGNREYYEMKLATVSAIDIKDLTLPHNIPVATYIQEAENLYHWVQADKEPLIAAGLDWELVDDFPLRTGALIHAESLWVNLRTKGKDVDRTWKNDAPEAYELRNRLLNDFRFAFRKEPERLNMLKAMVANPGHATMLQDLNDLSVMGKAYPDALEAIGFDVPQLDRATGLTVQLSKLLAQVTTAGLEYDKRKLIRDQAFTYLKAAVDEVYQCGKYVFKKDASRLQGYSSQFLRRKRQQKKKQKT